MVRVREYWGRTRVTASPDAWVEAAPFRAHVLTLMAWGRLSAEEVAELALVSRRAVRRLVHGRDDGRAVLRICPYVARRLLRVQPEDVGNLEQQFVPATVALESLVDLLRTEGRVDVLAGEVGVEPAELWAVIEGAPQCSRLFAVRIRVAGEELMARQFEAGQVKRPLLRLVAAPIAPTSVGFSPAGSEPACAA